MSQSTSTGAGGGNVGNVDTPLDNQVAVWKTATTIEGDAGLTFDGTDLNNTVGRVMGFSGALAAPTFGFTGDATGLGMSRPTSQALNFVTSSTERMHISAAGLVGIGRTPTTYPLEVAGTIYAEGGSINSTGAAVLSVITSGTDEIAELRLEASGSGKSYITYGTSAGTSDLAFFSKKSGVNTIVATLDDDGKLGLGKTPSYALDVQSTATSYAAKIANTTTTSGYYGLLASAGEYNNSNIVLRAQRHDGVGLFEVDSHHNVDFFNSSGNVAMTWDGTNSRLGIGTAVPEGIFHGSCAGNCTYYFDSYSTSDANHAGFIARKSSNGDGSTIATTTDGEVLFSIDAQGVNAAGTPAFSPGAWIAISQDGTAGSTYVPARMDFYTSPGGTTAVQNRMSITAAGNVGFGTDSPISAVDAVATGTGTTEYGVRGRATGAATTNYGGYFEASGAGTNVSLGTLGDVNFMNSSGATKLTFDSVNVRLGIGRSPSYALDVEGASRIIHTGGGGSILTLENGEGSWTGGVDSNGGYIQGSSGESFRILADGSFGVGMVPSFPLDVTGQSRFNNGLFMPTSEYITFYGSYDGTHGIGSRNAAGTVNDDLRINSLASVFINLDSNANSGGKEFRIGQHGNAAGTIADTLFKVMDSGQVYSDIITTTGTDTGTVSHAVDFSLTNLQTVVCHANNTTLTLTSANEAAGRTVRLFVDVETNSAVIGAINLPGWRWLSSEPDGSENFQVELTSWGATTGTVTAVSSVAGGF